MDVWWKNFVYTPGIEIPPPPTVTEMFGISTVSGVELQHVVVRFADTG
jgi:hypothetical protein